MKDPQISNDELNEILTVIGKLLSAIEDPERFKRTIQRAEALEKKLFNKLR